MIDNLYKLDYIAYMKALHIKDFPTDLKQALKSKAALSNKTLAEHVIAVLKKAGV